MAELKCIHMGGPSVPASCVCTSRLNRGDILYIVVYDPSQRASFSIPVKSVAFKSFDYRRHRECAIVRLVSQLEHINSIPNAAIMSQ